MFEMKAANEIFTGIAVLKDWLGNGMSPVTQEKADQRAGVCLSGDNGKECPLLKAPNWLEEHSKEPVAQAIKSHLEKKSEMKLKTDLDACPRFCGACGCYMPTKVWVPIEYIAAHTTEKKISEHPAFCWQRIEIENL